MYVHKSDRAYLRDMLGADQREVSRLELIQRQREAGRQARIAIVIQQYRENLRAISRGLT